MVASTFVALSKNSQKGLIEYYRNIQFLQNVTRNETRDRLEEVDLQYQREKDRSDKHRRAQTANRQGDPNRYQNMTVPIVMPQVEAAVTHQTSVYLTGSPLFGVVASPEFMDEALQMETILENQSIRGGWARELILFFRDGFKHNISFLEVDWAQEVTYSIQTDIPKNLKNGVPKEIIWTGNRLRRLDPYNTFVDTRVPASEVYKEGEFAGFTELMSRIRLKMFVSELPNKIIANITPAFESGLGGNAGAKDSSAQSFYVPNINPMVAEEDYSGGTNWLAWAGLSSSIRKTPIDYKETYEVTTVYARILPSEFSMFIKNRDTPQIFKLIIVNHEHIIYAEQQTNAHNYLPILVGQPLEDGLGYQTKSLAQNGVPFQELATSYMTSIIASKRRAISDRLLYDPSRITSAHINSANPSAKIPVRAAAYGSKISDAVYHFPYNEDQAVNSMQQISTIVELSNQLAGQNRTSQGQFTKGNRTLEEFDRVEANSTGRDQLASILLEFQVFIPMKLILKLNILQFQGGTTVFNRDKEISVEIDPVKLRKAVVEFRVSDGLIPSEKIIGGKALGTALQVIGTSPQISAGYNIAPLFSYLMKTQGAELTAFEKSPEQVAFEQAMEQWLQLAQFAIDKEVDPNKLPPRPLPEEFNYDPKQNKPAPSSTQTQSQQQSLLEGPSNGAPNR